ncbi:MAG: hypothetical protein ABSG77_04780 [Candidatus Acidiferrum sp.]|jgi:hypothetical protein
MKPLFAVHGGEYLVGSHIEKHFKRVNVWIPSRDTGIDLLVSDHRNRRTVSLQVKFSKDYLVTEGKPEFLKSLRASGWWMIDRDKLRTSPSDFWVFVLFGFAGRTTDFVVVPRWELARRLQSLLQKKMIKSYLTVTERDGCWETRGLKDKDMRRIADGEFRDARRDLKAWLNNWRPVARLNR